MDAKLGLGVTAIALVICGFFTMNFGAEAQTPEQQAVAIAEQEAIKMTNLGIEQRKEFAQRQSVATTRPRQRSRQSDVGLH